MVHDKKNEEINQPKKKITVKQNSPTNKFIQIKKLWEAKNSFKWFGLFIKGPKNDNRSKYCYWVSFGIIQLLYFSMIAPYLLIKVSWLLFSFNFVMFFSTIVFSLITSYKDPGIIPRYPLLRAISNGEIPKKFCKDSDDGEPKNPEDEKKFWKTWKIWRPERASHWSVWDWWVEVFDHHCPYLNNWIGHRNYKYFIAFLCTITLDGLSIIASLIIYVSNDFRSNSNLAKSGPVQNTIISRFIIAIVGIASILLFLLVILLWVFHGYLIIRGKTTKEELTKKNKMKKSCLSWLAPGPANFKGGNHWLTKTQYDIYQLSWREVQSGMITENQDNLIMRIFHQQREEIKNKNFEDVEKLDVHSKSGWGIINYSSILIFSYQNFLVLIFII